MCSSNILFCLKLHDSCLERSILSQVILPPVVSLLRSTLLSCPFEHSVKQSPLLWAKITASTVATSVCCNFCSLTFWLRKSADFSENCLAYRKLSPQPCRSHEAREQIDRGLKIFSSAETATASIVETPSVDETLRPFTQSCAVVAPDVELHFFVAEIPPNPLWSLQLLALYGVEERGVRFCTLQKPTESACGMSHIEV